MHGKHCLNPLQVILDFYNIIVEIHSPEKGTLKKNKKTKKKTSLAVVYSKKK